MRIDITYIYKALSLKHFGGKGSSGPVGGPVGRARVGCGGIALVADTVEDYKVIPNLPIGVRRI